MTYSVVHDSDDVAVYCGDCLAVLRDLPADYFDSVVTDPPYGLSFMGKKWDYDVPSVEVWREVLRVLKPGGHLLSFAGSRTYHRMAVAVEDGGFEIRDQIMWLYGSGFPKSMDVSKAIDKAKGVERRVVGVNPNGRSAHKKGGMAFDKAVGKESLGVMTLTAPGSDEAAQWQGWGTALKPAHEPIVVARKPFKGTVAANVLEHGTGAINIDGCRVPGSYETKPGGMERKASPVYGAFAGATAAPETAGRFPANVIHDGSDEVLAGFPASGNGSGQPTITKRERNKGWCNSSPGEGVSAIDNYGDEGSAARFFYCAKANKKERRGSKHPTVKPLALMRYLVRLVTPPGGAVLDPFAGTGTTGEAAIAEGFMACLIEQSADYIPDIITRLGGDTKESTA